MVCSRWRIRSGEASARAYETQFIKAGRRPPLTVSLAGGPVPGSPLLPTQPRRGDRRCRTGGRETRPGRRGGACSMGFGNASCGVNDAASPVELLRRQWPRLGDDGQVFQGPDHSVGVRRYSSSLCGSASA